MATQITVSLLVALLLFVHTCGVWAVVEVNMEEKVEVMRGETAQITCMYTSDEGIGGTTIEWLVVTRSGEEKAIYFQDSFHTKTEPNTPYTDRISVKRTGAEEVVLTINNVQLQDEREFICRIKSLTDGMGMGSTNLRVFERPNFPTIESRTEGVTADQDKLSEIGTCQVKNGYPKPNITWYRNNTPLRSVTNEVEVSSSTTTESTGLFSVLSKLSLNVKKEDKDADFYCEATYLLPGFSGMSETEHINITVFYPSTEIHVWVESPKVKIKEGDTVVLQCSGNGNSPASFLFKHNDVDLPGEADVKVLENVSRQNSGVYQCTSTDMETFEELLNTTTVSVNYLDAAVVTPRENVSMAMGQELEATCNALSSLQTQTVWLKDGEEVSKGHILNLKAQSLDTAGTYVCVVTVPEIEGMETSSSLRVFVKSPPVLKEDDVTEVETEEETVVLSCHARGYPVPTITWDTKDGKKQSDPNFRILSDDSSQSTLSLKVDSNATVFCKASNNQGDDKATFNIRVKTTVYTTPVATTTTTTTTTNNTIPISNVTVKPKTPNSAEKVKAESNGVIIAVIIICILLLAILGSVLYFLYKKGKICGRSGKQDLTKEKSSKDNIVVEMKSDNTEESILLGANGEKQPPRD
ncbi:cell surface glycoprotein MUC18 isoform X3 [Oryzias latipes]|uniref:Melanoma cell adhesion molecule b n=1 Tax=Oryzias latipes TaxID=8090 RepID=A0A3B3H9M6_ORYLA|nr:cell surface glycoprotein MUC18 isoform X3 [Oryzias latipes]